MILRSIALAVYYGLAQFLPTQPVPGWKVGYRLRRMLVRKIFASCGKDVIVKDRAYFGTGRDIVLGNRSQIGQRSRIDRGVIIGQDVIMGPEVVIFTGGHEYRDSALPINLQGSLERRPVVIEDDVWLGTRVIIMPGVRLGQGSVVGAASVVTKSVPAYAVVAGNPARVVKWRKLGGSDA